MAKKEYNDEVLKKFPVGTKLHLIINHNNHCEISSHYLDSGEHTDEHQVKLRWNGTFTNIWGAGEVLRRLETDDTMEF